MCVRVVLHCFTPLLGDGKSLASIEAMFGDDFKVVVVVGIGTVWRMLVIIGSGGGDHDHGSEACGDDGGYDDGCEVGRG